MLAKLAVRNLLKVLDTGFRLLSFNSVCVFGYSQDRCAFFFFPTVLVKLCHLNYLMLSLCR